MQLARIPQSVSDELDKKIKRFLWRGAAMEWKTHLVACDVVTREKNSRGTWIKKHETIKFSVSYEARLEAWNKALYFMDLGSQTKYAKGRDLDNMVARGILAPISNDVSWKLLIWQNRVWVLPLGIVHRPSFEGTNGLMGGTCMSSWFVQFLVSSSIIWCVIISDWTHDGTGINSLNISCCYITTNCFFWAGPGRGGW